jgi:hypothetical protein
MKTSTITKIAVVMALLFAFASLPAFGQSNWLRNSNIADPLDRVIDGINKSVLYLSTTGDNTRLVWRNDEALNPEIERTLDGAWPAESKIAVLVSTDKNNPGAYPELAKYVEDKIKANLSESGRYTFIDYRDNTEFVFPGELIIGKNINTVKPAGQALGAQIVIYVNFSFGRFNTVTASVWSEKYPDDETPLFNSLTDSNRNSVRIQLSGVILTLGPAPSKEPDILFSLKTKFAFYPEQIQFGDIPVYPYGDHAASGYSLQLEMGMDLFKKVNLLMNFGIDPFGLNNADIDINKLLKIAGSLGTKYFGIVYEYRSTVSPTITIDQNISKDSTDDWYFPQDGEELNSYLTIGTLGLVTPALFGIFQLGLVWNSVSANLCIETDKDSDNPTAPRIAYMDKDRSFNTYGVRLALRTDEFVDKFNVGKAQFVTNTFFDFTYGSATLSDEAKNALGLESNTWAVWLMNFRVNMGLAWKKEISAKRSVTYGVGLDWLSSSVSSADTLQYGMVPNSNMFGIYASLGLVL